MSSCLMFGKCNRGWSDAYGIDVQIIELKTWLTFVTDVT